MSLLALLLQAASAPDRPLEWRLYGAAVKAAEASLRLHETDQARRWLSEAPHEHRGFEWHYLAGLAEQSSAVHALHEGTITDLAVSPDGSLLATASGDQTARLVEARTGATRHVLAGHTAAVWSPDFSADGRRLATASSDGTVRLWDVATGQELRVLPGNGKGVAALDFGPDGLLAVSSWDRTSERGVWGIVNLWDAESGERLEHLEHGIKPIAALAFSPDGATLAAGTWDNDVALWRVGEWGEPARLVPPENDDYQAVRDLAFSPDGKELAVSYADGRARRYDAQTRELLGTLDTTSLGDVKELNDVVYLPDGTRLATVGADLTLRLWERASGRLLAEYAGHERSVQTVSASPDGTWLYTAGAEGTVRAWDLDARAPERSVWRGPSTSYSLALDPEGERAAVTGWEGWVRMVEVASGRELARWPGHRQSGVGIDWSSDGRFLASTGNDGRVVLWDADSHALVRELATLEGQVLCARFSPDAQLLAAPGDGSTLVLHAVPDGGPVASLPGDGGRVGYLAFSGDGTRLAAGHPDGRVRLWDVNARTLVRVLEGHAAGQVALAFHPRADELLTASGRQVRRWHARTGEPIGQPFEAASGVHYLACSPDGTRIAAGLSNATLELWLAATGEELLRTGFTAGVWFTAWARDGRALFALPMDETVRVLRAR